MTRIFETNRLGFPRKLRFNLYLSEQELDALDRLAVATGLSIAEHARRAIDAYIEAKHRGAGREPAQGDVRQQQEKHP